MHRGLIKASGYVDEDEDEVGENGWRHWGYIQKSNKEFDKRRLDGQVRALRQANAAQASLRVNVEDDTMSDGSDHGPDDMVQVRLDSTGEIITMRAGDLQVREPESEDERQKQWNKI